MARIIQDHARQNARLAEAQIKGRSAAKLAERKAAAAQFDGAVAKAEQMIGAADDTTVITASSSKIDCVPVVAACSSAGAASFVDVASEALACWRRILTTSATIRPSTQNAPATIRLPSSGP